MTKVANTASIAAPGRPGAFFRPLNVPVLSTNLGHQRRIPALCSWQRNRLRCIPLRMPLAFRHCSQLVVFIAMLAPSTIIPMLPRRSVSRIVELARVVNRSALGLSRELLTAKTIANCGLPASTKPRLIFFGATWQKGHLRVLRPGERSFFEKGRSAFSNIQAIPNLSRDLRYRRLARTPIS